MHSSPAAFTYAGTKDKLAVTTQRVSALHVSPRALRDASVEGITLGNFSYSTAAVGLGDAAGNHFRLVLRALSAPNTQSLYQAVLG